MVNRATQRVCVITRHLNGGAPSVAVTACIPLWECRKRTMAAEARIRWLRTSTARAGVGAAWVPAIAAFAATDLQAGGRAVSRHARAGDDALVAAALNRVAPGFGWRLFVASSATGGKNDADDGEREARHRPRCLVRPF